MSRRDEVIVVITRIERAADRIVRTRKFRKRYRIVYDKRKVDPDFTTTPFGF